ncbi:MAG: hypothetical protein WKF90_16485 [Pyrinomonadaceae bacterium]
MKNYTKLLRKVLILGMLLFCLSLVLNDNTVIVQAETCDECYDIKGACIRDCADQGHPSGCTNQCVIAFNHCAEFCEEGGGSGGGNVCQYNDQCISYQCVNGYCAGY